jgi:hypothetical protein
LSEPFALRLGRFSVIESGDRWSDRAGVQHRCEPIAFDIQGRRSLDSKPAVRSGSLISLIAISQDLSQRPSQMGGARRHNQQGKCSNAESMEA